MLFDGVFMTKNSQLVVRKANSLIEALFDANTQQKRLIVMAAAQVRRGDEIGKTYSFSLFELKKLAKIENKNFYTEMEEVIETITDIKIDICTNPNLVGEEVRWFSYKGYDPIKKIVTFRMDKYVQEIMLDIKEAFTTYLATNALALNKGTYISLYELLKSYEYKAQNGKFYREFEIDHLTKVLGVNTETYKRFQDVRRFFFEPAIKAINKCTDIHISEIEYIKTGRSYTDVVFRCEQSDQTRMVIENKTIDDEPELENEKQELIAAESTLEYEEVASPIIDKLVKVGVSESTAKKWLEKFGENRIKQNLAYSLAKQKEGKVKNSLTGYIAKAIEEDWGKSWEDVSSKVIDAKRKAETDEKRKEREAEEKSKRDREERERVFAIFEKQPESMQDVILDLVELKNEDTPSLLAVLRKDRAKGNLKLLQVKSASKFKEAMQENGLI